MTRLEGITKEVGTKYYEKGPLHNELQTRFTRNTMRSDLLDILKIFLDFLLMEKISTNLVSTAIFRDV